jgi:membrane protein DedA with SNARE-associated domain
MKDLKILGCAIDALLASWLVILLIKTKQHGIPMTDMEFCLPIFVIVPAALVVELVIYILRRNRPQAEK